MESVRRFAAERRKSISALMSPIFESSPNNGEYALHTSSCAFPEFSEHQESIDISPPSSPTVPLRNTNGRRRFSPHRRFSIAPSILLRKERDKEEEKEKEKEKEEQRQR
ncbi:hypothetical protein PFISCL1PPCAC_20461, partial [Pristionchus fissidentatus]